MDTAAQLVVIQGTQFFADLRTQVKTILDFLIANNCQLSGTLIFAVDGVPVQATPSGSVNVHVLVGENSNGQPLYEWTAPIGWVS